MHEISRDRIREIFLANGFVIKEGLTDLRPYVYAAAEALIAECRKAEQAAERCRVCGGCGIVNDIRDGAGACPACYAAPPPEPALPEPAEAYDQVLSLLKRRIWASTGKGLSMAETEELFAPVRPLLARLQQGCPEGWISTSERLPAVGQKVVCFPTASAWAYRAEFTKEQWFQTSGGYYTPDEVAFWTIDLPAAPATTEKGEANG